MSSPTFKPGDVLAATWKIEAVLRRGQSGTVFAASDLRLGRQVAVKALDAAAMDPTAVARLEREAGLLARLSHPNLVALHTMDRHQEVPYLVLQFVEGQTLSERVLERGGLTEREVLSIADQAGDALAYLHEQGLLHRDLKPSNLMVSKQGHLTLIDLGITRTSDSTLTRTGVVHGTPGYMSPEAIVGEKHLDARADQYSLAAVLFELLTGAPPFSHLEGEALLRAHLTQPRPKAHEFRPSLPVAVSAVLARAMALQPDGRYPSVRTFHAAFRAALEPLVEAANPDAATLPGREALSPPPPVDATVPMPAMERPVPMDAPTAPRPPLSESDWMSWDQQAQIPTGPRRSLGRPELAATEVAEREVPPRPRSSSRPDLPRTAPAPDARAPRRNSQPDAPAAEAPRRISRPNLPAQPLPGPLPEAAVTPHGLTPLERSEYAPKPPPFWNRKPRLVWGTLVGVAVLLAVLAIFWPSSAPVGPPPPQALPMTVLGMAPPAPPPVEVEKENTRASSVTAEELQARRDAVPVVVQKPRPQVRKGKAAAPQRLLLRAAGALQTQQLGEVVVIATFNEKQVAALVEVDGVLKGQTPLPLKLPPGTHVLRLDYPRAMVTEFATHFLPGRATRLEVELPTAAEVAEREAVNRERARRGH